MSLDLQQAAARRMRRLVFVLVAVVVVLVAVVVALLAVPGSSHQSAGSSVSGASAQPTTPEAQPTAGDTGGAYVSPEKWVSLPSATSSTAGEPTGFPRTPQGAAALVVAAVKATWTTDAAAAQKAVAAYTLPGANSQDAVSNVQNLRQEAGFPSTGALPAGATLTTVPIGVQWQAMDPYTVRVFVLVRVTSTPGAGQPARSVVTSTTTVANWNSSGRWFEIAAPAPSHLPAAADLGTNGFNSAGWIAIDQGDH